MQTLIEFLKAMSDPTRLKMIKLLQTEELAVCEIAFVLNVSQPTVSQHLRKLERLGLIVERREGLVRYCCLDSAVLQGLLGQIQTFLSAGTPTIVDMQEIAGRLVQLRQSDLLKQCKFNCEE